MDKDLRQGTEEGLVRRPKSLTKTLPTRWGLFQAGCPQCQEGSAFPDDGFCREERNRETEAGIRSCSLGPLPVVPALGTLIRTTSGKGERLRAGRAVPFTHTKEVLAAQLLQQRGWRLSPQPPTLSSPSLGQGIPASHCQPFLISSLTGGSLEWICPQHKVTNSAHAPRKEGGED